MHLMQGVSEDDSKVGITAKDRGHKEQDMKQQKGILIFNEKKQERLRLSSLLRDKENRIFDTGDPLEAFHILQKENIGLIITGREFTGIDREDFKSLVEKIRPGVSVIFISPFTDKDEDFSVNAGEFFKLINDYTKKESFLVRETSNLRLFAYAIVNRLVQILEINDKYFFSNDHLVAELSAKIAVDMGLEENLVEAIQMGALLRDLGKVAIHQQILQEDKRLTEQMELTPIKAHPIHTVQILSQVPFPWNLDSIISQHHENYDGSGYPMGLKGREICIGARIIGVADAYYAMTTEGPDRRAIPRTKAIQAIRINAGKQFDPEVAEVFLSTIGEEASEITQKKRVLIFERETDFAPMIKLSMTSKDTEVIQVTNSTDVLSSIREKRPHLIIADMEALELAAFVTFYDTVTRSTYADGSRILLMIPDKQHLKLFDAKVDYILKPFSMEQLSTKIISLLCHTSSAEVQEETRGLAGNLEDFSLTDIIQILSLGLKTAKVEILRSEEKGTLYLLTGKIVHASVGNFRGRDAFFELIGWQEGTFHIKHGQVTDEINITADTMHLLLEGATILDEKTAGIEIRTSEKIAEGFDISARDI